MNQNDLQLALETIVDKTSMNAVLAVLAEVCRLKSLHLDENWQDRYAAKDWENASEHVERAANLVKI